MSAALDERREAILFAFNNGMLINEHGGFYVRGQLYGRDKYVEIGVSYFQLKEEL